MESYKIYIIPALMHSTRNYIYYLIDYETGTSAVIDPGETESIVEFLQKNEFKPDFILNTHHHWDHVNGNLDLKKLYDLKIVANSEDKHRITGVDIEIHYDNKFSVGNIEFDIIHTPGHTKNHIAFYSKKRKLLFCGDTMFSGGCGGLFEGTPEEMLISFKKFFDLPDDTIVYCAHEYTLSNLDFALSLEPNNQYLISRKKQCEFFIKIGKPTIPSTILMEKQTNPFMKFNNFELKKAIGCENDNDSEVFIKLMNMKSRFYKR